MLSSVQHFGLESKPAPAFAFLSWWVFKVCRIKFICLHKLNISYYNVFLQCVLCCPGERGRVFGVREAETRRMEGWTFWDDIKHRLDRRPDVDEPGLGFIVCFMLVSCALHQPDFPSTPVSNQINQPRPSPALHLLHWTFQLIIHVSASGVFLFLSLTCLSPPALISLVRFVCVSACVVGSLFVGPSVQLSSSRSSCYPAAFVCSPVCSLFLLYSLSKLPSPVGLLWPVCLSTFGFCIVLITYKRHEDTHILSVIAFGSCVNVDLGSSSYWIWWTRRDDFILDISTFFLDMHNNKKKTSFSNPRPSNFPVGIESKTWAPDKTQRFLCGRWFWSRKHQLTCPSVGRSVGADVDGWSALQLSTQLNKPIITDRKTTCVRQHIHQTGWAVADQTLFKKQLILRCSQTCCLHHLSPHWLDWCAGEWALCQTAVSTTALLFRYSAFLRCLFRGTTGFMHVSDITLAFSWNCSPTRFFFTYFFPVIFSRNALNV